MPATYMRNSAGYTRSCICWCRCANSQTCKQSPFEREKASEL